MTAQKRMQTEELNRPARFDVRLCAPIIINEFVSTVQVNFLMKIVECAYYGIININPIALAKEIGTSPHTIANLTNRFVEQEILATTPKKNEYRFLYYKDMLTDKNGFVKLYSFLVESPEFKQISLPGQRMALYLLSKLASQSSFNSNPIEIDVSTWYSRDDNRLFPFSNKYEVAAALQEASIFFSIDLSKVNKKSAIILKGLNPQFSEVHYSSGKAKWMRNFLEDHRCFFYNEFHLKHLVQLFDYLVDNIGLQFTVNVWNKAFAKARASDICENFFGMMATDQEDKKGSSDAAYFLRNTFLAEALEEEGITAGEIFDRLEEKPEENVTYTFWKDCVDGFWVFLHFPPKRFSLKTPPDLNSGGVS